MYSIGFQIVQSEHLPAEAKGKYWYFLEHQLFLKQLEFIFQISVQT